MSHWRYWTDCATRIQHWHWYRIVGRPEAPGWLWPCGKAAIVALPPLSFMPGDTGMWARPMAPPVASYGAPPAPSLLETPWPGTAYGPSYSPTYGPGGTLLPPSEVTAPYAPPSEVTAPPTETPIATPEPASLALLLAGVALALLQKGTKNGNASRRPKAPYCRYMP